jgi:hypothetical protein
MNDDQSSGARMHYWHSRGVPSKETAELFVSQVETRNVTRQKKLYLFVRDHALAVLHFAVHWGRFAADN